MIAVMFEVRTLPEQRETYLELAAALAAELATIDGFLSIERFQSLSQPDAMLSLSFWRDEAAVTAWRERPAHRSTQSRGRSHVFAGYRLRVAHVVRDYGMHERAQAPTDSRALFG